MTELNYNIIVSNLSIIYNKKYYYYIILNSL